MKPDQLIKRRGKLGLIKVNVDLQEAKKWVDERMGKDIQVSLFYRVQISAKSPVADCDIFFLVITCTLYKYPHWQQNIFHSGRLSTLRTLHLPKE